MKPLAFIGVFVALAVAQHWDIEKVDSAGWGDMLQMRTCTGDPTCLCYCSDLRIRVAFRDASWHYEDIDTLLGRAGSDGLSLAVGPQGRLGIATMRGTEVDYLCRTDSGWVAESTGLTGQYPCLAYDTAASPIIAYCYNGFDNPGGVLFGVRTDIAWVVDTVMWDVPQIPNAHTFLTKRLDVDRFDVPHLFVEDGFGMAAANPPWSFWLSTWARRTDTWTVRHVAGGGFLEYVTPLDLATDDSGREVVCYNFEDSYGGLWFKCDSEVVANSSVDDAAVRVDVLGRPHVVWARGGALYYAYRTSFWHVESVPTGQGVRDCDLLLDTLGEPIVAYSSSDGVWLAHGVGVVGQSEERPQPTSVGLRPSVTVFGKVLQMPGSPSTSHSYLYDMTGRRVAHLLSGANDVSGLAPGVYFVREVQTQARAVQKVIITR